MCAYRLRAFSSLCVLSVWILASYTPVTAVQIAALDRRFASPHLSRRDTSSSEDVLDDDPEEAPKGAKGAKGAKGGGKKKGDPDDGYDIVDDGKGGTTKVKKGSKTTTKTTVKTETKKTSKTVSKKSETKKTSKTVSKKTESKSKKGGDADDGYDIVDDGKGGTMKVKKGSTKSSTKTVSKTTVKTTVKTTKKVTASTKVTVSKGKSSTSQSANVQVSKKIVIGPDGKKRMVVTHTKTVTVTKKGTVVRKGEKVVVVDNKKVVTVGKGESKKKCSKKTKTETKTKKETKTTKTVTKTEVKSKTETKTKTKKGTKKKCSKKKKPIKECSNCACGSEYLRSLLRKIQALSDLAHKVLAAECDK